MKSQVRLAALFVVILVIGGCASPAQRFHGQAQKQGLTQRSYGALVVYQKGGLDAGGELHIYIDGDGTPALRDGRIASDPTSRERLILELMDTDTAPSVLIGRPCYYQSDNGCDSALWTSQRYGENVVGYMIEAVNAVIAQSSAGRIVLIGYSGGGTIAMLAAPQIPRLDTLITVAANLDIDAWTRHHGYAALVGSQNPAQRPPLRPGIRQFHYVGENDENVPASTMQHVVAMQVAARLQIVPEFDHRCCWAKAWPDILAQTTGALARVR